MRFSRNVRRLHPQLIELEVRIVRDAGFAFAAGIGDSAPGGDNDIYPNVRATNVGTDNAGDVYIAGSFQNVGILGAETGAPTISGSTDFSATFLAKYSSSGTLLWDEGLDTANVNGMAVDGAGDLFLTGTLQGGDVHPTPGLETTLSGADGGAFLIKLAPDGSLDFAEDFGGFGAYGYTLTLDPQGDILIAGGFNEMNADFDPGPGVALLSSDGAPYGDMFVESFNPDGSFRWVDHVGGAEGFVAPGAIATDAAGDLFITGNLSGTADFDPGSGTALLTGTTPLLYSTDVFAMELDPAGNYVWANVTSVLTTEGDLGNGGESIAVDSLGDVYIGGIFYGSVDFDPGPGTDALTAAAGGSGFVEKLGTGGNFDWAETTGSKGTADRVAVDGQNQVFVAGDVAGLTDIVPGPQPVQVAAPRNGEFFVMRLDGAGQLQGVRTAGYTPDPNNDPDVSAETITGLATSPSGNLAIIGGYSVPTTFGGTALPPLMFKGGQLYPAEAAFVALSTAIPTAPAGATLALDPASNSAAPGGPLMTDLKNPTFDVTGVPATASVTLIARNVDQTGPPDYLPITSRIGPGPLTVPTSLAFSLENEQYTFYAISDDPFAGVGVESNTVDVQVKVSTPVIITGPTLFTSAGVLIPPNSVTTDRQPVAVGIAANAGFVDLVDGTGNVLATLVIAGGEAQDFMSFRIPLPAGLSGDIELQFRARDRAGVSSALSTPFFVTLEAATIGSGGGGEPTGTGSPTITSVAIVALKHKPKVIQIVLSGDIATSLLTNKKNYTLRSAGRDRRFGTKDDKVLTFVKPKYTAATRTLTLTTTTALATNLPLELTIRGLLGTVPDTVFLGPAART
jgi:hypothetical protein